jgi:hypothetical protein
MRFSRWKAAVAIVVLFLAFSPGAVLARRIDAPAPSPGGKRVPRPEVLTAAVKAFECGRDRGYFTSSILTVIDYSLPSTEKRLWVIDLAHRRVLFHELVAHGKNSGENFTTTFSNRPNSKMSSLGLFRTAEIYTGQHGMSLRLDGLEPGFNERARERAIVMHGASYVSSGSIGKLNQLGRSWGCPAVSLESHRAIIDRIQNGTALFAYYPDAEWLTSSDFLHCPAATQLARRSR